MSLIKKKLCLFYPSLACFTLASSLCFSLPTVPVAQSGTVEVKYLNSHTMVIKASDDAILHYEDFQVGPGEEVHFEQSLASHHILGKNSSQILGSIQSAGKVALVNNNGFFWGPSSQIKVQKLQVEGSQICMQGSIDGTSASSTGGEVHLFGQEILLQGAKIDVSGLLGGGEVLIGGEFQGKGTTSYASKVIMDEFSEIRANAIESGDGGLVVLWSQDQTKFDGKIFAQSNALKGNGGLVETSSQGVLEVMKGKVNTLSLKGNSGKWLLDPVAVYIDEYANGCSQGSSCNGSCPEGTICYGGPGELGSGYCYIHASYFQNLTSHIQIISGNTIDITAGSLVVTGADGFIPNVTFTVCGNSMGPGSMNIGFDKPVYILTNGGSLTFPATVNLQHPCIIDTTGNGVYSKGGNICFGNIDNWADQSLTMNAGTDGIITMDSVSDILSLEVRNAKYVEANTISISGPLMVSAPLIYNGTSLSTNGQTSIYSMALSSNRLVVDAGSGAIDVTNGITSSGDVLLDGKGSFNVRGVTSIGGNLQVSKNLNVFSVSSLSVKGSILFEGDLTILDNSEITAPAGISIGGKITAKSAAYDLTLMTSNKPISVGAEIINIRNFTARDANKVVLGDIITSGGQVSILCPVQIREDSIISYDGGDISFSSTLDPCTSHSNLTINSSSKTTVGSISLQGLGTSGISFNNISLSGGLITLGNEVNISGTLGISNTQPMTISSGDILVGGDFNQLGEACISLGCSIKANGSVFFKGPLTVTGSLALTGLGGIQLSDPMDVGTAGSDLTLDAGKNILTFSVLGSSSTPFGNLSIKAGNLNLTGDVYSNSSILINAPITISHAVTLTGVNGISITGAVTSSGGFSALTLVAPSGPIEVKNLGSVSSPLGDISLTGSYITLGGNVTSDGSIALCGPTTITNSVTLTADKNITLNQDLSRSTDPFHLTILSTEGMISIQNLGNVDFPLGNISITGIGPLTPKNLVSWGNIDLSGAAITFDSTSMVSASGNITITNTGPLTIPKNAMLLKGDFSQKVGSNVSLGTSIETLGSINFEGALTITGNTVLRGSQGIIMSKSISPGSVAPALTLDAGSSSLTVAFDGGENNPFGAISIMGSNLDLQGNVFSTAFIVINPLMKVTADTMINSLAGTEGVALLQSVVASNGNPSLTVLAANGPVDVASLGSKEFPLGNISLSGTYVVLRGDITSIGSIDVTSPMNEMKTVNGTIIINQSLRILASAGINLQDDLAPSTEPFNLTLQSIDGSIHVQSLGDKISPLNDVSLIAGKAVTVANLITTTGILTIIDEEGTTTCGPGTYPPCNSQSQ